MNLSTVFFRDSAIIASLYVIFSGPDAFYVTNDNLFRYGTVQQLLYMYILNNFFASNIVYFDGFKAIEAMSGVHPNGIAMDKDQR